MIRITNSLFESIRQVTHPLIAEAKVEGKADGAGRVDGAHYCATHVEHSLYGEGECISEQHAKPNEDGTIDWYNVKFADGNVRKIQTEAVKVKKAKMHEHATPEGDTIEEKKLHPNQQVLDVHEPEKDELTAKDFEMLRKGKKAKTVKEEEEIKEGMPGQMGHAGKVTMKQIAKSSASPTVKKAIAKHAPDIKSYGDRAAALTAAGIKRESVEEVDEANIQPTAAKSRSHISNLAHPVTNSVTHPSSGKEIGLITKQHDGKYLAHPSSVKLSHSQSKVVDTKDQAHQHIRDAHAKAIKTNTLSDRWKKQEKLPQFAKEEVEEAVSETIVKHNDFTIEITDNPTFGDFLRAVQSIVRTDEESMQKEIVAIAEQAFAENYEEIIIESFTRMEIDDKMAAHRKAGNTVTNDKFSTKNGQPYAEYVVTDKEGGRKKYIHHGTVRRMESMPSASKRDKE
jgi:hypothetical protein